MPADNLTVIEQLIWAAAYAQALPSLVGFDRTARDYVLDDAEQRANLVVEARRDREMRRSIERTAPKSAHGEPGATKFRRCRSCTQEISHLAPTERYCPRHRGDGDV